MSRLFSTRSTSNRLIALGCLFMTIPCMFALLAAAFFFWPVLLPAGIR
jgi:hypothetical protein